MHLIGAAIAVACVFLVMYWWSEGMIDGSEAFILAVVYGCLAIGTFAANSVWMFLMAAVPLGGAIGYTWYSFKWGGLRSFYKARCRDYMATIQADPTNFAARQFLAQALYSTGELDRAIDEMEVAVQMGSGLEAQHALNQWHKERHMRDSLNPICRYCRTENARGARKCAQCGADLPYRSPINQWIAGGRTAASRYYLILTAGAALLVASIALLGAKYALIPIGLVLVALLGWSLVCSARS